MKRIVIIGMAVVLLLSLLMIAPASAAEYGTVVGGYLRLRTAPSLDATIIKSYYTGTVVEILSTSGDWYNVLCPDDQGWIHALGLYHAWRLIYHDNNEICHQFQWLWCTPAHRPQHRLPRAGRVSRWHKGNRACHRRALEPYSNRFDCRFYDERVFNLFSSRLFHKYA